MSRGGEREGTRGGPDDGRRGVRAVEPPERVGERDTLLLRAAEAMRMRPMVSTAQIEKTITEMPRSPERTTNAPDCEYCA